MTKKCDECGKGRWARRMVPYQRSLLGLTFVAKVPADVCDHCGSTVYPARPVVLFELEMAARLLDAGRDEPEVLVFVRKALGLQGNELARLLDVTPVTVSRWENGKSPIDRATTAVLRQMVSDKAHGLSTIADFLRRLDKPRKLPRTVRLEPARAEK